MLILFTPETIKAAWDSASPAERARITEFIQAQAHLYDDSSIVYFLVSDTKPVKQRGSTETRKVISAGCGFVFNRGISARELFPLLGITPGKVVKRPPLTAATPPRPSYLPKRSVLLRHSEECNRIPAPSPSQQPPPTPKPPPPSPSRKKIGTPSKSISGISVKIRQ